MVASARDAMHSTSQECKKRFVWRDYNRFSQVFLKTMVYERCDIHKEFEKK
jgi:hypothetical protein